MKSYCFSLKWFSRYCIGPYVDNLSLWSSALPTPFIFRIFDTPSVLLLVSNLWSLSKLALRNGSDSFSVIIGWPLLPLTNGSSSSSLNSCLYWSSILIGWDTTAKLCLFKGRTLADQAPLGCSPSNSNLYIKLSSSTPATTSSLAAISPSPFRSPRSHPCFPKPPPSKLSLAASSSQVLINLGLKFVWVGVVSFWLASGSNLP